MHTVIHNLIEGIVLVTLILLIFMADWHTTLTVGIVVPLALLFAFVCLRAARHEHQPTEHGCD